MRPLATRILRGWPSMPACPCSREYLRLRLRCEPPSGGRAARTGDLRLRLRYERLRAAGRRWLEPFAFGCGVSAFGGPGGAHGRRRVARHHPTATLSLGVARSITRPPPAKPPPTSPCPFP